MGRGRWGRWKGGRGDWGGAFCGLLWWCDGGSVESSCCGEVEELAGLACDGGRRWVRSGPFGIFIPFFGC